ncbi:cysteine and tyrosine-rich protein 1-like [Ostrea edulis]|uniref:cysteine and tyrosine-rich protein 1-like n=1 Tax=Ostrea edulis TaxID=37623 RepID=UPI0024AF5906|nr:cysteine and tyrosine-rich protein 1-like [Ostrea edulis]XP_056001309.1 cysteine and tyrosine-rich protein 1-like [Ostrea edulis]
MLRELEITSTVFLNFGVYFALAGCYYRSYYNSGDGAVDGIIIGVFVAIGLLIFVFVCVCIKNCKGVHIRTRSRFGWPVANLNSAVTYQNTVRQTRLFHQQPYPTTTLNNTTAPVQTHLYGNTHVQYGIPPPFNAPVPYSATYTAPPPTYSSVFTTHGPVGKM